MQVQRFNDDEREAWLAFRRGKITGTRLKDLYSKRDLRKKKIDFYALAAERIGLPPETDENAMERGARLEADALDRFAKETGKKVDKSLIVWSRDDDESIAISTDGVIGKTEAVEAKCLSSARHIEAYLKKHRDLLTDFDCVPEDYQLQALQYFVVNDKLKRLYFVFYDPRFAMFDAEGKLRLASENPQKKILDFFYLTIKRSDVKDDVEEYLTFERNILQEVDAIVNELTF